MNEKNIDDTCSYAEDDFVCPHCNAKGQGVIIRDYSDAHNREVLIECEMCDKLYKIYYKFDKIVKLNEE